jgi:hypothetical protein
VQGPEFKLQYCQNKKQKNKTRDWGFSLLVEHLPNMHKALTLFPSTAKNNNKKKLAFSKLGML